MLVWGQQYPAVVRWY